MRNRHKTFFVIIVIIMYMAMFYWLSVFNQITGKAIITPSGDDIHITENTSIDAASSPYNLQDSNNNGLFIIDANDLTLNCTGSVFQNGAGIAVIVNGHTGINITNCSFNGFNTGVMMNETNNTAITNSTINSKEFDIRYTNSTNALESSVTYANVTKRWKMQQALK